MLVLTCLHAYRVSSLHRPMIAVDIDQTAPTYRQTCDWVCRLRTLRHFVTPLACRRRLSNRACESVCLSVYLNIHVRSVWSALGGPQVAARGFGTLKHSSGFQRRMQAGVDLGKELINWKHVISWQNGLLMIIYYTNLLSVVVFNFFLQLTLGSHNGIIPINKLLEC